MTDDISAIPTETVPPRKFRSYWAELFVRMVKEKPLGTFGLVIVVVMLLVGIFANQLAPYAMNEVHLSEMLRPPLTPGFFLGTDQLGRDILSNLIYGARISVIIGLAATALSEIIAIMIGTSSALIAGKFDLIMQRVVDAMMCIPPLLVLLTLMGIVGKGVTQLILIMGITGGIMGSRLKRSAVIAIRENAYVQAAVAIGSSNRSTLWRHIIPNIMPVIIISFSMGIGSMVMMEASLSFLGFGVPPGIPSYGSMISFEGRTYMERAPQLAIWPGLCLAALVFGCNMLGDAMRDLLDPRLRGGVGRYGGTKQAIKAKMKILRKKITQ